MDRRHFGCGCIGLLSALSLRPVLAQWQVPPPFARPETASDEGGLWALMDREEARLRRSSFLIRDKALHQYVSGIACRLAGDHCPGVRVYLVRTPVFNASMAPNGMMQVWSGLLLRMANEAQLAAVLGHEIGHYLARHMIDRLRDAKSRSAFGQFLGLALGVAGAGGVGSLAQLLLLAGMFSYNRDQEREADRIGVQLMTGAGYPAIEASRVWQQLLDELEAQQAWAGEGDNRSVLFATHPPEKERQQALAELAQSAQASVANDARDAAYRQMIAAHRRGFLEDELRRRKYGESLTLFERMLKQRPNDADLEYFRGEVFRLRADAGDAQRALESYAAAERCETPPPELYRGRGLVHRQLGDAAQARQALRRYLELKPQAEDAELMKSYVKEEA